jgi:hypothetical protein
MFFALKRGPERAALPPKGKRWQKVTAGKWQRLHKATHAYERQCRHEQIADKMVSQASH